MNLSDDLILLTNKLMLVNEKSEAVHLASEFNSVIEKVISAENDGKQFSTQKATTGTLKFTLKEISKMSATFKKYFILNGLVTRCTKRPSGKKSICYELRYRSNGYDISASSTDLAEAKRKFLKKTEPSEIDKYKVKTVRTGLYLLDEIAEEWLLYKNGKIVVRTHENYKSYYRRYISPKLGQKSITAIHTIDIDKVMSNFSDRLYEDLRIVFNSIFKYALNSGIITYNPVALIPFKKAARNTRRALTKEEQSRLLLNLEKPEYTPYRQCFLVMLYFGLRPCEIQDARFEGNFLIARNAKRKGGKIEYKKIPICRQAREKLDIQDSMIMPHRTDVLNRIFKRILEDETATQYYLRHTFATKCQEYVRPDIVDIWMGDSSERLVGRVYTHFSDEFMQEQMDKVIFDI